MPTIPAVLREQWLVYILVATAAAAVTPTAPAGSDSSSALGGSADVDGDGDVDLDDYRAWPDCLDGPNVGPPGGDCPFLDFNNDQDVDFHDFAEFQTTFHPATPPAGNRCSLSVAISGENTFAFNNSTATRDGPPHATCIDPGAITKRREDQINNDIWMCWTAPCSERVVVETCGRTTIDTRIAVYQGCICPVTGPRLLACDDDACGVQSRATFQAQAGSSYLIRLGNFPGTIGGAGSVRVACGFDACPASGDCFSAHANVGCSNLSCCNTVCAADSICCNEEWDEFCAQEAGGLCTSGFEACGSVLSGSCRTVHATPGCVDESCCNTVCAEDSVCCLQEWDNVCVALESEMCFGACTVNAPSCFESHAAPGCNTRTCCADVCPRDPFCCSSEWDIGCTDLANLYCR